MKPARLPPRQTQASALLLPPGKVVSQPAKSGHGIAGHQHLTKLITAPGCQALSDCGTAEREKEPRRQKGKRKKERREEKKRQREKRSQEVERKAMARRSVAARSGVHSGLEKGSGDSHLRGQLGTLPAAHCLQLHLRLCSLH